MSRPRRVHLIAGESSGDLLGAALIASLREALGPDVTFRGMGGPRMEAAGLVSTGHLSDIAIIGLGEIARRLPLIVRRLRETVADILAEKPDILVVIDSPEFTQRVAKRVRAADPSITIVKYVAPQIWAWRSGRGKVMRAYIDHVLALLPFEPAYYARVGGPPTTFVGHPLLSRIEDFRPNPAEAAIRARVAEPLVLVLPGSRSTEVQRLAEPFAGALSLLRDTIGPFRAVLPTVPHLAARVREVTATWPVPVDVREGEAAKLEAFREARVALAASGTVTLELALARVPTVVAYRLGRWTSFVARKLIKVDTAALPHHVIGRKFLPELLLEDCTAENLAAALAPLVPEGEARAAQLAAFDEVEAHMTLVGETPAARAARVVLETHAARTSRAAKP